MSKVNINNTVKFTPIFLFSNINGSIVLEINNKIYAHQYCPVTLFKNAYFSECSKIKASVVIIIAPKAYNMIIQRIMLTE